jgi:hypothetical protein
MKRVFARMDYEFKESVFFTVSDYYGDTEHFEVTGVSYALYSESTEPSINLMGYELTKTGRRRKADTSAKFIYVPKTVYVFNGVERVQVDTPRVALEATARKYWDDHYLGGVNNAGTAVSA